MAEGSLNIDKLKSKIGLEWEPQVYEIERGMIRQFVRAVDDPNPLWQDEEYARQSKYGGIIAPPTLVWTIGLEKFLQRVSALAPFVNVLNGGTELECYQPVRPGDMVTAITKITGVRERQGKTGKVLFMTLDTTYKNQRQELVARCQDMVIGNLG